MKEKEVKDVQREHPKGMLKDYNEVFKDEENNKQNEKEEKMNESINTSAQIIITLLLMMKYRKRVVLEIIKPT